MTNKHVRFISTPELLPRTSYTSSASSSPEPAPFKRKSRQSSRPHSTSKTTIHRAIAYHSPTKYDLRNPPSTVAVPKRKYLSEAACRPTVPYMTLVIPHLPWSIVVPPASNGFYVTVSDIFSAIYAALRQPVSVSEYDGIASDRDKSTAARTYEDRCRSVHGIWKQQEKLGGIRWVDFLGRKNRFAGVALSEKGGDIWEVIAK